MEPTASVGRTGAAIAASLAFLALVPFAAGCGADHAATPPVTRPTTTAAQTASRTTAASTVPAREFPEFRIAMDGATDYLDPGLSNTTEGWGVMWNVYLPLLGYRHANGPAGAQLVPYLAASLPHVSRNGKTYKLTLRKGLRYSNGTRVEATDFKRTIERDFALDSAGASFFLNIVGARHFRKTAKGSISGIVTDNAKRTIVIHLRAPEGDFENVLASEFAAPVPPNAPRADTSLHPLPSTGPYEIQSYQPHGRIVEVRNPYFHRSRFDGTVPVGNPDKVVWDLVPNARTAFRRVLAGQDDWMSYYPVPADALRWTKHHRRTRLRIFTPANLTYFFMNTRLPPFDNPKVRRAVNFAISRGELARLADGLARPTENVLPPTYPSFRRHDLYPYNLRKARRLVRQSGDRGMRVTVWNHAVAADLPFTEYLVSVLDGLGFRAQQKVVTASDYWTTIGDRSTRAQIGFAVWLQDYPQPLDWFDVLLNGQRIGTTENNDYAYFNDRSVNRAIDGLKRRLKLTRSVNLEWAALDRKVMELAPWAPFLNREETDFFSQRVDLGCYVNNVLYEFDYATICVRK